MKIETHLRKRAKMARVFFCLWMTASAGFLLLVFLQVPEITDRTVRATLYAADQWHPPSKDFDPQFVCLSALTIGLVAICTGSYLLARTALKALDRSILYSGLADALCIAGDSMAELEKAVAIFVPRAVKSKALDVFPLKEAQEIVEILKKFRP